MFKTLYMLALMVPLAAAATCKGASCATEQDETSLVQVKTIVEHGGERIPNEAADWPTPVHDDDAVADSTPDNLDAGAVMDSFTKNAGKVRDQIESEAASRIDFTVAEREKRKAHYRDARDAVAADRKSTEEAIAADKAAVAKTKKAREEVVEAATERVKEAKEAARAHAIKAAQAKNAAALGRKVGAIEGADAAHHAWKDFKAEVKAEHKAAALKVNADKVAAHEAKVEKSVSDKTAAMAEADDDWVARANRAATVAKAKAAAAAAKAELGIEGAEGLKNRMTDVKADWAVKHYERLADGAQESIDEDAAGEVGIDQLWTDSQDAGPDGPEPEGGVFAAPEDGLETTDFQEELAGA